MGTFVDLTGKRFGRWTVVELSGRRVQSLWRCRCDCGVESRSVLYGALVSGKSRSCGCGRRSEDSEQRKRLWVVYTGMKTRCYNQRHPTYRNYGGRGIAMCQRWKDSFEAFASDMGYPEAGQSLDRKDNDGPYSPENCRWSDRRTQQSNRRNNRWHDWKGRRMTLTNVARSEQVDYHSLYNRVVSGMEIGRAVEECRGRGLKFRERARS